MMFIDAHCHINGLDPEERNNIASTRRSGYIFIDSSINFQSTLNSLQLSDKYPYIYSAIGFHPFSVKEFNESTISDYEKVLHQNKKIVAIGEIGLDETAKTSHEAQEKILKVFFQLAKNVNLPVLIHNRLKEPEIFDILDDFFTSYEKVVFHCFSYDYGMLQRITERGGYVSFSLNILRKKKDIIDSLIKCPLENILLETDSPYMKIDGHASSPLDIEAVYSFAAAIKNLKLQELKEAVCSNANKVFSFK